MERLRELILLLCILWPGLVPAQGPSKKDVNYKVDIIYFGVPYLADNYRECISGTKENARLSDDQQIGCEDRYNASDEDVGRSISPELAEEIKRRWGGDDFFKMPSNYIYQLDEAVKGRSIYLWPAGPGVMTPADDSRYGSHPLSIYLSASNSVTGKTRSVPVLLYEKKSADADSPFEHIHDFDLVDAGDGNLMLDVYRYESGKRVGSDRYMINQAGELTETL